MTEKSTSESNDNSRSQQQRKDVTGAKKRKAQKVI
jgi:hypothetical protein